MRIVCHNAFWFQGHPFPTDKPGDPVADILSALAALYRRLAPDLLCVQEVQGEDVFRRLSELTGMPGSFRAGTDLEQYGGAVLWRQGRLAADSRAARVPTQRMWQIAEIDIADGAALRAANVHLPSARQLGEEAAARQRIEEMASVLDARPSPDVVLGDFNERPGGALGTLLTSRGYADAAALSGRDSLPTNVGGTRGDQAWVAPALLDRVSGYGVAGAPEMAAPVPGKQFLSDHFPLWLDLNLEAKA